MATVYFARNGCDTSGFDMEEVLLAEVPVRLQRYMCRYLKPQRPKGRLRSDDKRAYGRVVIEVRDSDDLNEIFPRPGIYLAEALPPATAEIH